MINRLQLLRNIGLFDSVSAGANLSLGRLTLIYAENGRGKTTLASVLRSLATGNPVPILERRRLAAQHPPQVVLDCDGGSSAAMFQNGAWNRTVPNMAVFDDVFVDQNVYSGLAVAPEHRQNLHELILGSQGIALARNLQALAERMAAHNAALREKGAEIPPAQRGSMSVDDFCALTNQSDVDVAIQAAERNLGAVQAQDAIRTSPTFSPLSLPRFDVPALEALLGMDLPALDAAAAASVQGHLAGLGAQGEAWVADGMRRVHVETGSTECPFCAQDLRGSPLVAHYRAYFSQEYASLKDNVANALSALNRLHSGEVIAAFERSIRLSVERRQFWARFVDLPEIGIDTAAIARDWQNARNLAAALLEAKLSSPLDRLALPADVRAAIEEFHSHSAVIASLNDALLRGNSAIDLVKEGASSGNAAAIAGDLGRLRTIKARYTAAMVLLCDAYTTEKAAKAETEQAHGQARIALDRYREAVFPAYQTAINQYLQRFYAGFRIHSVTSANPGGRPSCNYSLVINDVQGAPVAVGVGNPPPGTPTFKNTLSAGDRNTLALAFFFASLDLDSNLSQRIVVIDDPMSSLDDHRSLTTAQEIRALAARARQVIVLSHDKRFLCKVWERSNRQTCVTLAVTRDQVGSTIEAWSVSDDCITDYDRQHARIRDYVRLNTGDARQVAQDLRHILEGFLRRACPEHFMAGEVLGEFRRRIAPVVPPVLAPAVATELDAISEYANRYHHETNPAWETEAINDTELMGWSNRTLDFVIRATR